MKEKRIRAIITFVVIIISGIVYIAIAGDSLAISGFGENSNVVHAILYSAAAICAMLVMTHGNDGGRK